MIDYSTRPQLFRRPLEVKMAMVLDVMRKVPRGALEDNELS
jgi:hypothetical protein